MMKCQWCGVETNGKFCSPGHKNRYRIEYGKRTPMERAIKDLGGKCSRCGWDESQFGFVIVQADGNAYDFRHARPWHIIESEIADCTLLCANCDAVQASEN